MTASYRNGQAQLSAVEKERGFPNMFNHLTRDSEGLCSELKVFLISSCFLCNLKKAVLRAGFVFTHLFLSKCWFEWVSQASR